MYYNYIQSAVPAPNNGPAWLTIIAGAFLAAYGNKRGQQVGIALIGVGANKLLS
jgi:hypothetical protein